MRRGAAQRAARARWPRSLRGAPARRRRARALGHARPRAGPDAGLPGARLRRTRTAASTRAPTTTRPATRALARVSSTTRDGTLLRSWTIPGQDLSQAHGVQVATSDARGRLVLLDKSPARVAAARTRARDRPAHVRDLRRPGAVPAGSRRRRLLADVSDRADAQLRRLGPGREPVRHRLPAGRHLARAAGGGRPQVWLSDRRLDGGAFGTTGIVLAADQRTCS